MWTRQPPDYHGLYRDSAVIFSVFFSWVIGGLILDWIFQLEHGTNATYLLDGLDLGHSNHSSRYSIPGEYILKKLESQIDFNWYSTPKSEWPFANKLRGDECLNSVDARTNPRCRDPFKAIYKGVIDISKLPETTEKMWFQIYSDASHLELKGYRGDFVPRFNTLPWLVLHRQTKRHTKMTMERYLVSDAVHGYTSVLNIRGSNPPWECSWPLCINPHPTM